MGWGYQSLSDSRSFLCGKESALLTTRQNDHLSFPGKPRHPGCCDVLQGISYWGCLEAKDWDEHHTMPIHYSVVSGFNVGNWCRTGFQQESPSSIGNWYNANVRSGVILFSNLFSPCICCCWWWSFYLELFYNWRLLLQLVLALSPTFKYELF